MFRIALSGKMKSGKSTLAQAIVQAQNAEILSFAGPIREALAVIGITKEEYPDLYREGAQYIGTDLVRAKYPDWWVAQMAKRVSERHEVFGRIPRGLIVIDDMRFENELDYCQSAGFICVRLDVSEGTQLARGAEKDRLTHPSETSLDHITREEWDLWLPEQTSVQERLDLISRFLGQRVYR